MRLTASFYQQNAEELAPLLLGKILCRQTSRGLIRLAITETECYRGEEDTACHAHKGKTPRTKPLYESGGIAYVYLCYGIHNLLNVVTGEEGSPQAVLIRGVEGYHGPGKLTKAMEIDRSLNEENLITSDKLWLEDDGNTPEFVTARRIGIDYAEEKDRNRLWRFIIQK